MAINASLCCSGRARTGPDRHQVLRAIPSSGPGAGAPGLPERLDTKRVRELCGFVIDLIGDDVNRRNVEIGAAIRSGAPELEAAPSRSRGRQ